MKEGRNEGRKIVKRRNEAKCGIEQYELGTGNKE